MGISNTVVKAHYSPQCRLIVHVSHSILYTTIGVATECSKVEFIDVSVNIQS